MTYESVEEYLNEEFHKPIKHYLKDTPKKTQEKVMQVVDYLCDKYRFALINGDERSYICVPNGFFENFVECISYTLEELGL